MEPDEVGALAVELSRILNQTVDTMYYLLCIIVLIFLFFILKFYLGYICYFKCRNSRFKTRAGEQDDIGQAGAFPPFPSDGRQERSSFVCEFFQPSSIRAKLEKAAPTELGD